MEKRIVPNKNYVMAALITMLTILILALITIYYNGHKEFEQNQNKSMGFLSEITSEELDNYIVENHSVMIYLSDSTIENNKIESKVKKQVQNNGYEDDMIYIDMQNLNEEFFTKIADKYFSQNLTNTNIVTDSILFVKDGKIVEVLNLDENNVSNLKNEIERVFY